MVEQMLENDLAGLNKRLSQVGTGKPTPTITINIPTVAVTAPDSHKPKPAVPTLNLPDGSTHKAMAKGKSETNLHHDTQNNAPTLGHSHSAAAVNGNKDASPREQKDKLRGSAVPKAKVRGSAAPKAGVRGSMRPEASPRGVRKSMAPNAKKGVRKSMAPGVKPKDDHERASTVKGLKPKPKLKPWESDVQTPEAFLLKNLKEVTPLCYEPSFTASVEKVSDEVLSISHTLVKSSSAVHLHTPERLQNMLAKSTVRPYFTEVLDGIFPERLAGRDWFVEVSDIKSKRLEALKAEKAWARMQAQEQARTGLFPESATPSLVPHTQPNTASVLSMLSHATDESGHTSLLGMGDDDSVRQVRASIFSEYPETYAGEEADAMDPSTILAHKRQSTKLDEHQPPLSEHQHDTKDKDKHKHAKAKPSGPFAHKGDGKSEKEEKTEDEDEYQQKRYWAATKIQTLYRIAQAKVAVKSLREDHMKMKKVSASHKAKIFEKNPMIDSAVAFTLKPHGVVMRSKFSMLADIYAAPLLNAQKTDGNKKQFRFGDWHKGLDENELPSVDHLYPEGKSPSTIHDSPIKDENKAETPDATTPSAKPKKEGALSAQKSAEKTMQPDQLNPPQPTSLAQSMQSPRPLTSTPSFFGSSGVIEVGDTMTSSMTLKKKKKKEPEPSNRRSRMHDVAVVSPLGVTPTSPFAKVINDGAGSQKMDALTKWAHAQKQSQDTQSTVDEVPRMPESLNLIPPSEQDDRELLSKAKLLRKRRWALVVKKNKSSLVPEVTDVRASGSRTPSPTKNQHCLEVLTARMLIPDYIAQELHFNMAVVGDDKLTLAEAKKRPDRWSPSVGISGPDEEDCYSVNFSCWVVKLEGVEKAQVAFHKAEVDMRELRRSLKGSGGAKLEPTTHLCSTKEMSLTEVQPGLNKAPLYQRGSIVGEIVYVVT